MTEDKQAILDQHNRIFVEGIDDVLIALSQNQPELAQQLKGRLMDLYGILKPELLFTPRGIDQLHVFFEMNNLAAVYFDALAAYIGCKMDYDELWYVHRNFIRSMRYATAGTVTYMESDNGRAQIGSWNKNSIVDQYNESRKFVPLSYTVIHVIVGQFLVLFSKSNIFTQS